MILQVLHYINTIHLILLELIIILNYILSRLNMFLKTIRSIIF